MNELLNISLEYLEKNLLDIINESFLAIKCIKEIIVEYKNDGTQITEADKKIHKIITDKLSYFYNQIPIISEEGKFNERDFEKDIYWLIDPLDGTNSYSAGKEGYTINIALIQKGVPVLGIIGHPPSNSIWFGSKNTSYKLTNKEKKPLKAISNIIKPKIVVSNNIDLKTQLLINKIKGSHVTKFSSSIKFCKIAEGNADLYPRLQSINKWDIAAGDAILRTAGGMLLDKNLEKFDYKSSSSKTGIFFAVSSFSKWKKILKEKI